MDIGIDRNSVFHPLPLVFIPTLRHPVSYPYQASQCIMVSSGFRGPGLKVVP
jgi:hypothetical protein